VATPFSYLHHEQYPLFLTAFSFSIFSVLTMFDFTCGFNATPSDNAPFQQ
jgi:hypothetical protein